jgi:molybdopterin-containing oxidoreductase family membrane subunit
VAKNVPGVLATYRHVDAATESIRSLRRQGRKDLTVYSAAPNHEIETALGHKVSPVRLFTLLGGITGCTAGLAMTFWMSLDWPLLVGGKPIATVPPYVVIMFELTVLCGSLMTVTGIVVLSALLRKKGAAYDPRYTDDRIGIFVPCRAEEFSTVESLLKKTGAEEVRHVAN